MNGPPGSPPHDDDAEHAVLGAMMLERSAIDKVVTLLAPEDFYGTPEREIFTSILAMRREGTPVDVQTLGIHLKNRGRLDAVGGMRALVALYDAVPTAANAEHYAGTVKDSARLRALHALGQRLVRESVNGGKPAEIMTALRGELDEMVRDEAADTFTATRCADFLAAELTAPLWVVEEILPGGGVSFLFSRPGLGKSFFAFELARCVARAEPFLGRFRVKGEPAIYCNLEMAPSQFQNRLRLREVHHAVGDAPLYLVSQPLALSDGASFARFGALVEKIAPTVVVIDPLIRALPGVDENAAPEVNQALSPAADLARELGFGLLPVHHATKGQGRFGLDSLAGSRDFAARADVALLMQAAEGVGDGAEGLLRVTWVKSRWAAATQPLYLRLDIDPEGHPALTTAEAPSAKADILELFEMREERDLMRADIVRSLEGVWNQFQVDRALGLLVKEGRLQKPGRGLYRLADGPQEGAQ